MKARINVWAEELSVAEADLAGKTFLFIPGTTYSWTEIKPSKELSAVLCLLTADHILDYVRCLTLEADLVHELGFEVV